MVAVHAGESTELFIVQCSRKFSSEVAYGHRTFPLTICLSVWLFVCVSVGPSIRPVHCGKMAYRFWMRFWMIGRVGPWMRQVVGFGDRSTAEGNFGGTCGELVA